MAAVLFALLAVARPEAAAHFLAWLAILLACAGFALHRLVRWPTGELGIFISYRRDDSRETVGRLHDALRRGFDASRIFLDVAGQPGEDYRAPIGHARDAADVVLVIIGPRRAARPAEGPMRPCPCWAGRGFPAILSPARGGLGASGVGCGRPPAA